MDYWMVGQWEDAILNIKMQELLIYKYKEIRKENQNNEILNIKIILQENTKYYYN